MLQISPSLVITNFVPCRDSNPGPSMEPSMKQMVYQWALRASLIFGLLVLFIRPSSLNIPTLPHLDEVRTKSSMK